MKRFPWEMATDSICQMMADETGEIVTKTRKSYFHPRKLKAANAIRMYLLIAAIILFIAAFSQAADYEVEVHLSQKTNPLQYAVKLSAPKRAALASGVNTPAGIITCAHVVEGRVDFTAVCDGETAPAKVVKVDKQNDLALLSVAWTKTHAAAAVAVEGPILGETLLSVGRQKDGTLLCELHQYKTTANNEYQYTNPPCEGRSGSGVFDERGKLVGIVLGKIVDNEPYVGRAAIVEAVAELVRDPNAVSGTMAGRIQCTVHTASWCVPCHEQQKSNGPGDERISFTYTNDPAPTDPNGNNSIPCTTFRDRDGKLLAIRGQHTTEQIWKIVEFNTVRLK